MCQCVFSKATKSRGNTCHNFLQWAKLKLSIKCFSSQLYAITKPGLIVLCLQRHGEDPDPQGLLSVRLPLHPGRPDLVRGAARGRQGDLHQQGAVLRRDPGVPPRPRPGPQVRHSQVRHHARVQVLLGSPIQCMLKWVCDLLRLLEWVIWPIGAMRGSLGHTFTIMLTFTLSMKKF